MDDYFPRRFSWILRISANGDRGDFLPLESRDDGKKKPTRYQRRYSLREVTGRTSGVKANFVDDNAQYVLGCPKDSSEKEASRSKKCHEAYLSLIQESSDKTGDAALRAIANFLASGTKSTPPEMTAGDNIQLIWDPDGDQPVWARPAVRDYWESTSHVTGKNGITCLVCGTGEAVDKPHPMMKGVPGPNTSKGAALISFNKNAFESYGLLGNENAPLCSRCIKGYTSALNRLLARNFPHPINNAPLPMRRVDLSSESAALFWAADEEGDGTVNLFVPSIAEGNPDSIKALFESPRSGSRTAGQPLHGFFAMIVSGAQARMAVRSWLESTVEEVANNVIQYFKDLELEEPGGGPGRPLSIKFLLESLAPPSRSGRLENLPSDLATRLFLAAIQGDQFPRIVLDQAVRRMKADAGASTWELRPRCALIKAVLNRKRRSKDAHAIIYEEVKKTMDPNNTHSSYRLGRLLAALDSLQARAINKPNSTIIDRYYGAASTRPATVYPTLLKLAQHHMAKLDNGKYFDRLIAEILEPVDQFPKILNLEEQGLFALGYYHQKASGSRSQTA